jgi:hypothetical protein
MSEYTLNLQVRQCPQCIMYIYSHVEIDQGSSHPEFYPPPYTLYLLCIGWTMGGDDSTSLCSDFGVSGDGCGGWFPQKPLAGLCDKCEKLSALEEGSAEYNKLLVCHNTMAFLANFLYYLLTLMPTQDYTQCIACGTTYKRLVGKTCGARACVEYGLHGSPLGQADFSCG